MSDLESQEPTDADVYDINLRIEREAYAKGMAMASDSDIINKIKDLEADRLQEKNQAKFVRLSYQINGYQDAFRERTGIDPKPAA